VERVTADFQLLGVQLLKMRFSWGEILAALKDVKPHDVSLRRVRLVPSVLHAGARPPAKPVLLGDPDREALLAELLLAQQRLAERHPETPWSLILEKGYVLGWRKDVQVLEDEPTSPTPKPTPSRGPTKPAPTPAPPPKPAPPPPPGPRPGSGGAGPTTGG
jgi:hypothetical protein